LEAQKANEEAKDFLDSLKHTDDIINIYTQGSEDSSLYNMVTNLSTTQDLSTEDKEKQSRGE